jgi:arylsulfatase A-like enzyme
MHLRKFTCLAIIVLSGIYLCQSARAQARSAGTQRLPNIIIIFADDLGYADVGAFGAKGYVTPHLDQMAREGIRLTNFYSAQAVCSASRAALLTGCYPNRVGIRGALNHTANHGINADETLIAEVVKTKGYATAAFGKWHLGHHPQFLPTRHGFDEYLGLPYSNDMWPKNPAATIKYPDLPLIENEKVIESDPDQSQLTTRYTERAVSFIERHKDKPFLLYLAHSMPHVPLFVSDKFRGKTSRGLYGDVISEIDWSVGQILNALRQNKIDDNTLVIFTSDNGPWALYGDHGGSAAPLRGYKATAFDGGVRVPFIARWPKRLPAGRVIHNPAMTIDLLPTVARLIGAKLPADRIIDGRDLWALLSGVKNAPDPHDALYFYWGQELQAVRSGRWKLHLPHDYDIHTPGNGGGRGKVSRQRIELSLFNLETDIGETTNVADQYPDVVKRLMKYVERARTDLGDSLTGREGKNLRPAGKLGVSSN